MSSYKKLQKKCLVEGCNRLCTKHNYCTKHQTAYVKYGDPLFNKTHFNREQRSLIKCRVKNCKSKSREDGYCNNHYNMLVKYGDAEYSDKLKAFYKAVKEMYTRRTYDGMKYRCKVNPRYIVKGIKVCKEWDGRDGIFAFVRDMGLRPSRQHSLDRIDNNKGYNPENCRWADVKTQQRNKDNNRIVNYKGVDYTLADFSEKVNLPYDFLRYRLNNGYSVEEAIKTPKRDPKPIYYKGKEYQTTEFCRVFGVKVPTLINSLKQGTSIDDFLQKYKPRKEVPPILYKGKKYNHASLDRELGMPKGYINRKINKGFELEDIIKNFNPLKHKNCQNRTQ